MGLFLALHMHSSMMDKSMADLVVDTVRNHELFHDEVGAIIDAVLAEELCANPCRTMVSLMLRLPTL